MPGGSVVRGVFVIQEIMFVDQSRFANSTHDALLRHCPLTFFDKGKRPQPLRRLVVRGETLNRFF